MLADWVLYWMWVTAAPVVCSAGYGQWTRLGVGVGLVCGRVREILGTQPVHAWALFMLLLFSEFRLRLGQQYYPRTQRMVRCGCR